MELLRLLNLNRFFFSIIISIFSSSIFFIYKFGGSGRWKNKWMNEYVAKGGKKNEWGILVI